MYSPTREGAQRLALLTFEQMTRTLAWAVENPTEEVQVLQPTQIKRGFGKPMMVHRRAASA
ncbi:MAG: hypothetical protein WCC87_09460 [Candidatus Korobacteraceae bacterium]